MRDATLALALAGITFLLTVIWGSPLIAILRRFKIGSEMHLYEKGPHGFGTRADLGPTSDWPKRWEDWMHSRGWLNSLPAH